jgi:hypothetical protein
MKMLICVSVSIEVKKQRRNEMSLPPHLDPGNPANPNSPLSPMNYKKLDTAAPETPGEWIATSVFLSVFAIGVLAMVIKSHLS